MLELERFPLFALSYSSKDWPRRGDIRVYPSRIHIYIHKSTAGTERKTTLAILMLNGMVILSNLLCPFIKGSLSSIPMEDWMCLVAECLVAECRVAECQVAECRMAECRVAEYEWQNAE